VADGGLRADGLRGNDGGDQRWCDCGRILLVGFSSGVFDSSSSLTFLHMKSELQPGGRVATMIAMGGLGVRTFVDAGPAHLLPSARL
jgi:hypothetical protein